MARRIATLVLLLALTGCGAQDDPEPALATAGSGLTTFRDDRDCLTVTFPSTWRRAPRDLTPSLTDPIEVLTVGTGALPVNRADARCAQTPTTALTRMRPTDVLLTVQERRGGLVQADAQPGRPRIDATPADRNDARECAGRSVPIRTYWMPSRVGGRGFYALAAVGERAPSSRRRALQAVLDALRVDERRLEDDRQRGLRFWRPAGWRTFPFALTSSVQLRHQVALGTFALDQSRPDPNCAPASALDARPGDGGFLFVFEYPDLNPRQIDRFAHRPRRFVFDTRDPRGYECFGRSRLLRWREGDRAFQAHVYGEGRRLREALGILDTFAVRARRR